jgi:hypothetical protein
VKILASRVRIKDVVIDVPKSFLFGAKDLLLESIRLRVPTPDPNHKSFGPKLLTMDSLLYLSLMVITNTERKPNQLKFEKA